uniref:Uncharacterized protein n=1 Tax=Oryza nivara TaxID=4536 RepID=A0A0E0IYN1_ORYNI
MVAAYWGGTSERGRDDPVTGGEERGIDGGVEGVDLADPLVACNDGGEGRANGVDALNAVEVGGVDGGGQHPHAHITVANLRRGSSATLRTLSGGPWWSGRLWRAGTSRRLALAVVVSRFVVDATAAALPLPVSAQVEAASPRPAADDVVAAVTAAASPVAGR